MVLALVLGVFGLMGVGHLYVGKLTRGFIILAVGIILTVMIWASFFLGFTTSGLFWIAGMIAGVALIILWVWQTYDAYRLANEYNAVVQRTGRPAW